MPQGTPHYWPRSIYGTNPLASPVSLTAFADPNTAEQMPGNQAARAAYGDEAVRQNADNQLSHLVWGQTREQRSRMAADVTKNQQAMADLARVNPQVYAQILQQQQDAAKQSMLAAAVRGQPATQ